jgi:glyoxylase-like metal-dependent hydrolase (beta-lactamase superfamily II)
MDHTPRAEGSPAPVFRSERLFVHGFSWCASVRKMAARAGFTLIDFTSKDAAGLFKKTKSGDCFLVPLEEEDDWFLLDTGHSSGADNIETACEGKNIRGIFITHPDNDHYGGLCRLLKTKVEAPVFTDKLQWVVLPKTIGSTTYKTTIQTDLKAQLKKLAGNKDWVHVGALDDTVRT